MNLAAVLALQDYHSGNKTYQDLLGNMFSAYYAGHNESFLAAVPWVFLISDHPVYADALAE